MIGSLVWKEYREHRAVWLALAALAAGVTLGVPAVFPPDPSQVKAYREILLVVAVILAWTYGLVCGAMLLAGERESGTQAFLDTLPAPRLHVWAAKLLAAGPLVVLYVAAVFGCVVAGELVEPQHRFLALLAALLAGLLGLGWGLLFSARAGSVLVAVGQAILASFVAPLFLTVALGLPLIIGMAMLGFHTPPESPVLTLLCSAVMLALPWPVSALVYSAQDRERAPARPARPRRGVGWWRGWRAAWWLTRSQSRGFALGLALFCFAAGFPMAAASLILWPLLALVVGAVCGATAFLDEQSGPYRFLGDQRFPLTPLWLIKVSVRGFLGLCGLALLLMPAAFAMLIELGQHPLDQHHPGDGFLGRLFGSSLVGTTVPAGLFLLAPPLYGFALGHLCGLLFRKPLVALVAAFGLGVLWLSVWAPSFLAGGLHAWQVLLLPLVLLGGARLLLRPWSADRLASWEAAVTLGGVALLCVTLTGLGLWYRVAEVPHLPEPDGLAAFLGRLPTPEQNEAGRAVRSVLAQVEMRAAEWRAARPARPLAPGDQPQRPTRDFPALAEEALDRGWPADPATARELSDWLDDVFREEYWQRLADVPRLPLGVVDDPRRLSVFTPNRERDQASLTGLMLAARGLQRQHQGDPAAFVNYLDQALAVVRNLQNGGSETCRVLAQFTEGKQLQALDRWLEALDGRPDLLRRAGEVLANHAAWLPPTHRDAGLADYVIGLNTLDNPRDWISAELPARQRGALSLPEAELLAGAWRLPWERERQQRLWRVVAHSSFAALRGTNDALPVVVPVGFLRPFAQLSVPGRRLAALEAGRLKVALRHYQAEKGRPAEALHELVPGSIASIPPDPFDGQPFRYRLSKGEEILLPNGGHDNEDPVEGGGAPGHPAPDPGPPGFAPAPVPVSVRKVPAGQGILWSVGEDHHDGGGRSQGLFRLSDHPAPAGTDLIYLVPRPAEQRQRPGAPRTK